MATISELEARINSLEQTVLQMAKNNIAITEHADCAYGKGPQVDNNTVGVSENDSAICDVAELSDENSSALEELAEMIDDLETRVEALEGKGE